MIMEFCDICGNEITPIDKHSVRVFKEVNGENKPTLPPFDLCSHCKEDLKDYLYGRREDSHNKLPKPVEG